MKIFSRRGFLATLPSLAALPLLHARKAQAETESLASLIGAVTGGAPLTPGRVKLEMPRLADNGNAVPLTVSAESPMTESDHVRSIHILSEKNPRPVIARFHFGPKAGRAQVATRVRLNGTQRVVAIAAMSDGSFWSGVAEVAVTISACLDGS